MFQPLLSRFYAHVKAIHLPLIYGKTGRMDSLTSQIIVIFVIPLTNITIDDPAFQNVHSNVSFQRFICYDCSRRYVLSFMEFK